MPPTGHGIEYLGFHWATRSPVGDNQITINYVKTFSDWLVNFCFSRGVDFSVAKEYEHIIPSLLGRVWDVDNSKESLLWEMGNQGSVTGDVFVKVAYDPPFVDSVGNPVNGRVRVLPLNSAYCYPEWHAHDRDRMIRFKLKYKFWGTTADGTRTVYTYTEVLTDDKIQEFVNDELIDERPNPLGEIPIAYAPNIMVSGSPWGLSDIGDIVPLNREYNEKSTDISEIINYYSAPITIIKGAKAGTLEKGARKIWSGLPKDAEVTNLANNVDLTGPLAFLDRLKMSMHELTGVPESALGQMQPISNTAGVALAIMYQPAMQRFGMKKLTYSKLLKRINRLILKTLFACEPNTLMYDPNTEGIMREGQAPVLDPHDPLVYETGIEWQPPLPVDVLVKLNEITQKMQLGLESKRGALRDLGTLHPDEKMQEVFEELVQDSKDQAALDYMRAQINSSIMAATGMAPDGSPQTVPTPTAQGATGEDSQGQEKPGTAGPQPGDVSPVVNSLSEMTAEAQQQAVVDLVTQAYGTKMGARRPPVNAPAD